MMDHFFPTSSAEPESAIHFASHGDMNMPFAPVLKMLIESDDSDDVDSSRIVTRSGTVHKAIEDEQS